jgi:hypothetical protein
MKASYTGETPSATGTVAHCINRTLRIGGRVRLWNEHAADPEVEVLEDDLAIILTNAHERRQIVRFGGENERIDGLRGEGAVFGIKEHKVHAPEPENLDNFGRGEGRKRSDRDAISLQRILEFVHEIH